MKIRFLGDVHGKLRQMPVPSPESPIVQVGDLGVGFVAIGELHRLAGWPDFRFIRGNHDHPDLCRRHSRYLGEYGVAPKHLGGFFFVSGAYSIDRARRIEGRDWWPDEELSERELMAAIELYERTKPSVVVSHEAPESIGREILEGMPFIGGAPGETLRYTPSRTALALQAMLETHRPRLWIHGHYHLTRRIDMDGTHFVGLAELEVYETDL